jgi:hypothetical protein
MFRIFLNLNSISYSFRSIANQNSVRYSDSTSYFKKYSSSKCKQTVCLHYGLDFHFNIFLETFSGMVLLFQAAMAMHGFYSNTNTNTWTRVVLYELIVVEPNKNQQVVVTCSDFTPFFHVIFFILDLLFSSVQFNLFQEIIFCSCFYSLSSLFRHYYF